MFLIFSEKCPVTKLSEKIAPNESVRESVSCSNHRELIQTVHFSLLKRTDTKEWFIHENNIDSLVLNLNAESINAYFGNVCLHIKCKAAKLYKRSMLLWMLLYLTRIYLFVCLQGLAWQVSTMCSLTETPEAPYN